mgnify:CR=1 FL=1
MRIRIVYLSHQKEEKPLEDAKGETENKPIIDVTNPDTGDTIISTLVLGVTAVVGIVVFTKYKRKEN